MNRSYVHVMLLLSTAFSALCARPDAATSAFATMNGFLATNDLAAFVAEISKQQWLPPLIHSKWFVDKMTNMDARAAEYAYREFGRLLAQRLTSNAAMVRAQHSSEVYYSRAAALLTFGHWIAGEPGYGNLLLSWRASDIAAVALAKVIIDLSFSTNQIQALMPLLNVPAYRWSLKAKALNEEVGMDVFETRGVDDIAGMDIVMNPVYRTWGMGASTAERVLRYHMVADPLMLRALPVCVRTNLEFFLDDVIQPGTPDTIEGCWDKKLHKRIGEGFDLRNRLNAQGLLLYRELVGFFPTKLPPPAPQPYAGSFAPPPGANEIALAFSHYWHMNMNKSPAKELRPLFGRAAYSFISLKQGRMADADFLAHGFDWSAPLPSLDMETTNGTANK
jgi:hypothetical protein